MLKSKALAKIFRVIEEKLSRESVCVPGLFVLISLQFLFGKFKSQSHYNLSAELDFITALWGVF